MPFSAITFLVPLGKRGHFHACMGFDHTPQYLWDCGTFHDTMGKSQGSFEHVYKEQNLPPGGFTTSNFLLSLVQAGSCYEQFSH